MTLASPLTFTLVLIAACVLSSGAVAQNGTAPPVSGGTTCTPAKQLKPAQIHGLWRVSFQSTPAGLPATAGMLIERHAEFSDSVAGYVSRELKPVPGGHAPRAQLAGDLEDGFLTLDESSNGVSITGTWNGEMVEGSCGKKVTGTWKDMSSSAPSDAPEIPFTLEKISAW